MELPAWLVVLGAASAALIALWNIWTRGIVPLARAVTVAQKVAPFLEAAVERGHGLSATRIFDQVDELKTSLAEVLDQLAQVSEQVDELNHGTMDLARTVGQLQRYFPPVRDPPDR